MIIYDYLLMIIWLFIIYCYLFTATKAHTHSSFSWWSKWRGSPSHSQPSFFLEQRTFMLSTLRWSYSCPASCWTVVYKEGMADPMPWRDQYTPRSIWSRSSLAGEGHGTVYSYRRQTGHVIESGMESTNSHSINYTLTCLSHCVLHTTDVNISHKK